MEMVSTAFMPGDPRLIDHIVYELKAKGIFDQFRKECISDVDTKPAYQNLRQRVEGNVVGFLKKQSWKHDMSKNYVREMLRKSISESGFLETGVEHIVNQVVNPKINTVFTPEVETVVYRFLGIEKPKPKPSEIKLEPQSENQGIMPMDLEAVSPLSETKSPKYEPIEEPENSLDSRMSGISVLASHESNQSATISESTKMDISEDSFRTDSLSQDVPKVEEAEKPKEKPKEQEKPRDRDKHKEKSKEEEKHKSREKSKDNDKRKEKEKPKEEDKSKTKDKDKHKEKSRDKSKHKSSEKSDKDKDKSKSHRDDKHKKPTTKDKEKDKSKEHTSKDKEKKERSKSESSSSKGDKSKEKHRDESKDKSSKERITTKSGEDKSKKEHKERKDDAKHKSSDDSKSKSSSSSKNSHHKHDKNNSIKSNGDHRHSSSKSTSKHDKDRSKDKKKENKDDHYSSKNKKSNRRSTDRDSSDGQSGTTQNSTSNTSEPSCSQIKQGSSCSTTLGSSSGGDSGNSEAAAPCDDLVVKLIKPKFASNIFEARKLMKIRKALHKIERQIQVVPKVKEKREHRTPEKMQVEEGQNTSERKVAEEEKKVKTLATATVSKDAWDALETKLLQQNHVNYTTYGTPEKHPNTSAIVELLPIQANQDDDIVNEASVEVVRVTQPVEVSSTRGITSIEVVEPFEVAKPAEVSSTKGITSTEVMELTQPFEVDQLAEVTEQVQVAQLVEVTQKVEVAQPVDPIVGVPQLAQVAQLAEVSEDLQPVQVIEDVKLDISPIKMVDAQPVQTKDVAEESVITAEEGILDLPENSASETPIQPEEVIEEVSELPDHPTSIEVDQSVESVRKEDDNCLYLSSEVLPEITRYLAFATGYIRKLESDIRLRTSYLNNVVPLKRSPSPDENTNVGVMVAPKRGRKRKGAIVHLNNNDGIAVKAPNRLRNPKKASPNPPASKSKRLKLNDSIDNSHCDSFNLPLSPAESDKSFSSTTPEKKLNNIVEPRQLRRGSLAAQRYTSDDLYKPRLSFTSRRRADRTLRSK